MKDISTRTVAVGDVIIETLHNGAQRPLVMVIQHFVPSDMTVILELLHLISMHIHTGSIGLFNGVLYFNCLCYKVAFSVFFLF